jgi:predicted CXXCH cytochrome family protein
MKKIMLMIALTTAFSSLHFFAGVNPCLALVDAHECVNCHVMHGSPAYSLLSGAPAVSGIVVEDLCLDCHDTDQGSVAAAASHNPNGRSPGHKDYITCRQCHDPHDNYINVNGDMNIKLVGIRFDPETGDRFPYAVIKDTNNGTGYVPVTFASRNDFNISGTGIGQMGICEVCHDPNHRAGQACTDCHAPLGSGNRHDHVFGFMPR